MDYDIEDALNVLRNLKDSTYGIEDSYPLNYDV